MRDTFQGAMEQLDIMWCYQPTKRLGHGVVPRQDTGTPIMMSAEKIKQKIVPIMRTMVANNPRASELTFAVVDGIKTTQYHIDPKFMATVLELADSPRRHESHSRSLVTPPKPRPDLPISCTRPLRSPRAARTHKQGSEFASHTK